MSIPILQEQVPKNILEIIVERPQSEEAPETEPLLVSLARYNRKECQIDGMNPKIAKKALKAIRDIGVNIKTESDFSTKLPKLRVEPVDNDGDYRALYRGLTDVPDAVVQEVKLDLENARLFFHMVGNIFHIIAIRESHYDTH